MGTNSLIEWTNHTLNLWHGCVNVSSACDHCYAEAQSQRWLPRGWLVVGEGHDGLQRTRPNDPERPEIWGPDAPRIFPPSTSKALAEPFKWNREAAARGIRARVFVMSMGDIFEKHRSGEVNAMMKRRRDQFFNETVPACPLFSC